jgi:phytoene synthase
VIRDVLSRADELYRDADRGLAFLPVRPRLAVLLASRLYREIGRELLRRGGDPYAGRAVVPPWRKLLLSMAALCAWVTTFLPSRGFRSLPRPRRSIG